MRTEIKTDRSRCKRTTSQERPGVQDNSPQEGDLTTVQTNRHDDRDAGKQVGKHSWRSDKTGIKPWHEGSTGP